MSPSPRRLFVPIPGLAVHAFELDDAEALQASRDLLEAGERARAERFRQAADQARFITGRAALRRVLAAALGQAAGDLSFVDGPQGKPQLAATPGSPLEFNVSHSGDWVLVALSNVGAVGVDVEQARQHAGLAAVAATVFSPRECAALQACAAAAAVDLFYRLWTCKEAWLKALGTGLDYPLKTLDLLAAAQAAPGVCTAVTDPAGNPDWRCWRLPLDGAHSAAVVISGEGGAWSPAARAGH